MVGGRQTKTDRETDRQTHRWSTQTGPLLQYGLIILGKIANTILKCISFAQISLRGEGGGGAFRAIYGCRKASYNGLAAVLGTWAGLMHG